MYDVIVIPESGMEFVPNELGTSWLYMCIVLDVDVVTAMNSQIVELHAQKLGC